MKKITIAILFCLVTVWLAAPTVLAEELKTTCGATKTTICTIEIWLAYQHKKNKRELKKILKSKSIKVLHRTFQFWKPKGGHPPTNIAIGGGLNADDARWVINFALKYNDRIESLIFQRLNAPNYAAIASSQWDDNSETPIRPEDLELLKDPKLTTEEFHTLYVKLTDEKRIGEDFYKDGKSPPGSSP
jgi:hypothetical protein